VPELIPDDPDSWRRFFAATGESVGVEMALPWITNRSELSNTIATFVRSLLFALGTLGARMTPRHTRMAQDFEPRRVAPDAFLFSHHSIGAEPAVCRFKHSYRRGYFSLDPDGYSGYSRLAREPALLHAAETLPAGEALDYARRLRTRSIAENESKFAQPPLGGDPPAPGYVLLPLQVLGDTVLKLARDEPLSFYRRVVAETGRLGKRCVVKRHPKCTTRAVSEFLAEAARRPHVEIREDSVNQLLPDAERVVVVNSGVGMESLCHGRPTLTFGGCEYAPYTRQIRDLDDVTDALAAEPVFDETAVARFLLYFFEHYCVRCDDEAGILRRVQQVLAPIPERHGWTVAGRQARSPGI
jgi:hypothetical protein